MNNAPQLGYYLRPVRKMIPEILMTEIPLFQFMDKEIDGFGFFDMKVF